MEDETGERDREHDARLADGGDRGRRGQAQRGEHEAVRAEAGEPGHDRGGSELGPHAGRPGGERRDGGRGQQDELEVRDRGGVLDALVVHERVAGDGRGDGERECQRPTVAAQPASHRDHPDRDERHACELERGRAHADRDRSQQHEHRRAARAIG